MRAWVIFCLSACMVLLATAAWGNEPSDNLPAMSPVFDVQPEAPRKVAYSMTKIEGECRPECKEGEVCREGKCMPAERAEKLNLKKVYCDPLRYEAVGESCVLKEGLKPVSVAGAWALEFFIGFGAGGYYTHNTGIGVAGTVFSLMFYGGMAAIIANNMNGENLSKALGPFGMGFMALGSTGRLITILAVPMYAVHYNEELESSSSGTPNQAMLPPGSRIGTPETPESDEEKKVVFKPGIGGFALTW